VDRVVGATQRVDLAGFTVDPIGCGVRVLVQKEADRDDEEVPKCWHV